MITIIYLPIISKGDKIDAQLLPSGLVKVSKKNPMNIEARPMIKVIFFRKAFPDIIEVNFCGCIWEEKAAVFPTVSECSLFEGI